ncbi:hypothetical protein A3860_04975 [Niastella vici]|uniref:YknX-like C-terminal permuted SH3-like domain-containing protein n=1 Tax=Niastella vici TaxID=1703345 RepID=A0A1V9FRV9_9BACT|nr:efflux RND transporter periplasmic adaptor subunit [Niastella vici]OQP61073.1 hypothetical protein A3860_04975 [Niastella vici]
MKGLIVLIFLLSAVALQSCESRSNEPADPDNAAKNIFKKEAAVVTVAKARLGNFDLEINCNGNVYAINNAEIKFPFSEKISAVLVKNGEVVKKGQVLASLDETELAKRLARSREAFGKALIDLDDRLIDYGYRLKDSVSIPTDIMRMARIKSGYNSAQYDYADAETALNKTRILAPFSGKIANLEAREFNTSENFRRLCTLIDDSKMRVEFNVLESEYRFLSKGSPIEIVPYGDGASIRGVVNQINPLVDANGMIKIIGMIDNQAGHLLDGMSVKVVVRKSVPGKLFIPKDAVLQRQDREVVFTYNNGRAKWNYVQTDLQNSKYVSIKDGLREGEQVITSNNINLAHDLEVKIDKNN